MRMQITLKSGAQIEADVSEFTTKRNPITGDLTKLEWRTPDGHAAKLNYLDLKEVAAIVAVKRSRFRRWAR